MKGRTELLAVLGGMTAAVAAGWIHTRADQERLRLAIAEARERVEMEAAERVATRGSAEVESRNERAAVDRLRQEFERLKRSAAERMNRRRGGKEGERKTQAEREPSIIEEPLTPEWWRNRGRGSPSATMETALWAAGGGDVQALAELLLLDAPARQKAAALLEHLPVSLKAECRTPEQIVALMATADVPLSAARIIVPEQPKGTEAFRVVQLFTTPDKFRLVSLNLRQVGNSWGVVVPERAVERYAEMLRSAGR